MLRPFPIAMCILMCFAAGLLAADATVVSYDKDTMKLTVKVGDKDQTIELKPTSHVHDVNGKELGPKDWPQKFKKDVKLQLIEKNGKVVEINIRK